MQADLPLSRRQLAERLTLCGILAIAAVARLWLLTAGVPHAVGIDEPIVVDHALRILHTGDWNPHVFNYPSLVIYLHAAVAIVRFLWGALSGQWASLDGFDVAAVYQAGRFVTATATVTRVTVAAGIDLFVDGARRLPSPTKLREVIELVRAAFGVTDGTARSSTP